MGRMSVWVVLIALGVVAAFPPRIEGQQGGTAASQMGRAPTETDIYCAGFFTHRSLGAGMTVLGSEDGGFKNEYGDRDFIYLSKGQAASPGGQYMLVRAMKDTNPRDSFPGGGRRGAGRGTLHAEIGRSQGRRVHDG